MKYVKNYYIFYSVNRIPYMYKYNNYKSFSSMCKQMMKSNHYDYVKPSIILEWNSLQDLFSGTSYGSITPDGQPLKESIRTMETAKQHVKNSKQLTLNV